MFWILRRTGAANFFNSTFNNNYSSKSTAIVQTSDKNNPRPPRKAYGRLSVEADDGYGYQHQCNSRRPCHQHPDGPLDHQFIDTNNHNNNNNNINNGASNETNNNNCTNCPCSCQIISNSESTSSLESSPEQLKARHLAVINGRNPQEAINNNNNNHKLRRITTTSGGAAAGDEFDEDDGGGGIREFSDLDLADHLNKNFVRNRRYTESMVRIQAMAMSDDEDYDESLTCNVCDRAFNCHKQLASHQQKKRHFGCSGCDSLFPSIMLLEHHKEQFEHWSDVEEDNRRVNCNNRRLRRDDFTDTESGSSDAESEDLERLL